MAKNWTVKEASVVLAKGKNKEEILELGKRFPLATVVITKVGAGCAAPEAFMELMKAMPDYLTMNKLNSALKGDATDAADVEEDTEEVEAPAAKSEKKTEKKAKAADVEEEDADVDAEDIPDFESMSAQEMYKWGRKRGIKFKSTKKADMIAVLKEQFGQGASDDEEEEVAEEESDNKYAEMSVKELFKECKSRGIEAEIKKPAKYYIDLLLEDDAADTTDAEEDDDWGEEEEEVKPTPKKSEKKPVAKKPAKKSEPEDEEEDWDI